MQNSSKFNAFQKKNTFSRQCSIVLLLGIIRPRLSLEQIENRLCMDGMGQAQAKSRARVIYT